MSHQDENNKRLVYRWVPHGVGRVLDIGCSWGDDAASFIPKAKEVYGVDFDEKFIRKAQIKHPGVKFSVSGAEKLTFEDSFFDVVIMSEVLEHVSSEISALNEVFRVLKPGGIFIVTTPHGGLFSFLDPANQKFYLQKISPGLFNKFISRQQKNNPKYDTVIAQGIHRHYSLEEFSGLFNESEWRGHFKFEEVVRHGLLFGPLAGNVRAVSKLIFGGVGTGIIMKPFNFLARLDNQINFGRFAYQIELKVRKI